MAYSNEITSRLGTELRRQRTMMIIKSLKIDDLSIFRLNSNLKIVEIRGRRNLTLQHAALQKILQNKIWRWVLQMHH